jgi:hypothetical protein
MLDRHQVFYINVHHQINNGEVLPPPKWFWYYLPDLPIGIQNIVASI